MHLSDNANRCQLLSSSVVGVVESLGNEGVKRGLNRDIFIVSTYQSEPGIALLSGYKGQFALLTRVYRYLTL
jgi:hypothetical protein